MLSVALYIRYAKELAQRRRILLTAFAIATPLAYIGALGGGLLGFLGAVFFGTTPFLIILPTAYRIIDRPSGEKSQNS